MPAARGPSHHSLDVALDRIQGEVEHGNPKSVLLGESGLLERDCAPERGLPGE